MSFLVGPVSGALVAGGIYYGFSNMIQSRTRAHCTDLKTLTERLTDTQTILGPPPASTRIAHHPFKSLLARRWNEEVESLFKRAHDWDQRALQWGRKILYGDTPAQ